MSWQVGIPIALSAADIRPADMQIFHEITAGMNHFDERLKSEFTEIMKLFKSENYLLYIDECPVTTGILLPMGDIGGIFNLATLPEYQKKGLMKQKRKVHLLQFSSFS